MTDEPRTLENVNLALTPRQRRVLESLSETGLDGPAGSEEKQRVEIRGHLVDGQLIVDNLTVQFLHRWMDCADIDPK